MPPSALGDILRRQRELQQLSVRELARLTGISNPYLSQIERGLRSPSDRVIEALATTLDMSAGALYEQAGIDPEPPVAADDHVVQAITDDERLTPAQRRALVETYDAFLKANGHPRPRRRGR